MPTHQDLQENSWHPEGLESCQFLKATCGAGHRAERRRVLPPDPTLPPHSSSNSYTILPPASTSPSLSLLHQHPTVIPRTTPNQLTTYHLHRLFCSDFKMCPKGGSHVECLVLTWLCCLGRFGEFELPPPQVPTLEKYCFTSGPVPESYVHEPSETVSEVIPPHPHPPPHDQHLICLYTSPQQRYHQFLTTLPCLLYTSPSPRDLSTSRMPSSA